MFKKLFWPMQHCARSVHALLSRKPACTERAWGLHGPKYSFKHCGLCDNEFNNSDQVEEHLNQCEIYVCSNSHCRDVFEDISTMKDHIQEEHRKNSPSHYSFSYYICHSKNKTEKEVTKQYITIYPKDW